MPTETETRELDRECVEGGRQEPAGGRVIGDVLSFPLLLRFLPLKNESSKK